MSPTPNRRPEPKGKIKTGICENHNYTDPKTDETGDCPKCASGERMRIEIKRPSDFCCPVCGERLTPVKTGVPKWVWLVGAAVISAIIITVITLAIGGKAEEEVAAKPVTEAVTAPPVDTVAVEQPAPKPVKEDVPAMVEEKTPVEEKVQSEPVQSSGTHKLSYGTWKGDWKNGKPHGNGTMTYSIATVIDDRDSKGRTAQPGEYVIGEWDNGHLVQGRWFKSDGSKEAIIVGKAG